METYFKLMHPDVPKALITRMEGKMDRLGKLIESNEYTPQAYVEITKETGSQHSNAAWKAIINIDARAGQFHAEALADTPEKAAMRAVQEVHSALRTHQAKYRTLKRKGGGFWKSFLRGDSSTA